MHTYRRLAFVGGALICAAALWQCNDTPTTMNPVDLATNADLATASPDLAMPLALTSASPSSSLNAGGSMVSLTGTGFVQGSTVTIGGTMATVTFVSSTQLTVTVVLRS